MKDFSKTTQFLLTLADKADEILLRHYVPGGCPSDTKADNSPVTKADVEINSMVIEAVKSEFPDYGIYGEEESVDRENTKIFVVDPLDGTRMFAMGAPLFVFSAAVVIEGEPVGGVLHNPLAKRTLIAEKGKGAHLTQIHKRVFVSKRDTLKDSLIETGWSQTLVSDILHTHRASTPTLYTICESASILATGGFDGIVFTGRMAYDMAAAKIIVEEAGGRVTDLYGNDQLYTDKINGALVTNGHLHDSLLEVVKESGVYAWFENGNRHLF